MILILDGFGSCATDHRLDGGENTGGSMVVPESANPALRRYIPSDTACYGASSSAADAASSAPFFFLALFGRQRPPHTEHIPKAADGNQCAATHVYRGWHTTLVPRFFSSPRVV